MADTPTLYLDVEIGDIQANTSKLNSQLQSIAKGIDPLKVKFEVDPTSQSAIQAAVKNASNTLRRGLNVPISTNSINQFNQAMNAGITAWANNSQNTINHISSALRDMHFDDSAIRTFTQGLDQMVVKLTKVKADITENGGLELKMTGVDNLGHTLEIVKTYDMITGEIEHKVKSITTDYAAQEKAARKVADTASKINELMSNKSLASQRTTLNDRYSKIDNSTLSGYTEIGKQLQLMLNLETRMANAPSVQSKIRYYELWKQTANEVTNSLKILEAEDKSIGSAEKSQFDKYSEAIKKYYDLRAKYSGVVKQDQDGNWISASDKSYAETARILNEAKAAYEEYIAAKENGSITEETSIRLADEEAEARNRLALAQEKAAAQEARAVESANNALIKGKKALQDWSAAQTSSKQSSREEYTALSNTVTALESTISAYTKGEATIEDVSRAQAEFETQLTETKGVLQENGDLTKSFGDKLGSLAQKFTTWLSVSQVIMKVVHSVRDMINVSKELDSAMTELQIVTKESDSSMANYGANVAKTAKEIGASITDLIDATTTYARLGYSLGESSTLAELTGKLQNVGAIEATDAQDAVTAMIKAFDIDVTGLEFVMDRLVAVGNGAPISVSQIAEGMNNASSALAAAGNNIDQSIALLTAANTTIQNSAKSSTGLRTIVARIRNMKTELDDLGETMETADYDKIVQALTGMKVSLTDQNGELRGTYEIISDIAEAWETLSANEKAALAETLAGTRQQAVFFSLVENFDEAQKAIDLMDNSLGELDKSYSIYLDSIEAHINQFKAAFAELGSNIFQSDMFKAVVDGGTKAIEVIQKIMSAIGGLKTVIIGLAGTFATLKIDGVITKFNNFKDRLSESVGTFRAARAQGLSFSEALKTVGLSASSAQTSVAAFSVAITLLTALMGRLENARKERISKNQEIMSEAEAHINNAKSLETAYSEYLKYNSITVRTTEQEEKFQNALTGVKDGLNDKGASLDKLTEKTEAYNEQLEKSIQNQFKEEAVSARREKNAAKQSLFDSNYSWWTDLASLPRMIAGTGIRGGSQLPLKYYHQYGGGEYIGNPFADIFQRKMNGANAGEWYRNAGDYYFSPNIENAEAMVRYYYRLKDAQLEMYDALQNGYQDTQGVFEQVSTQIDSLTGDVEGYVEGVYNEFKYNFLSKNDLPQTTGDYVQYWQMMQQSLLGVFGDESLVQDIMDAYTATDPFLKHWNDIPKMASESSNAIKSEASTLSDLRKEYENSVKELQRYGLTSRDVLSKNSSGLKSSDIAAKRYLRSYNDYYSALSKSLKSDWAAVAASEDFEDARKQLEALSKTEKGITAANIIKLAESSEELAKFLEQDGISAQFLAKIMQQEMTSGNGWALLATEDALKLDNALQGLETRFGEVTEAQQRYNEANALPEYDEDFRSYAEAFKTLDEQFQAGTVGSRAFWNAAEFIFGKDALSGMNWNVDAIYSQMQNLAGVFGDADNAGLGFLDRLYAIGEESQIAGEEGVRRLYDESGNLLAQIKQFDDGSYDFNIDNERIDELAEKFGLTTEAVISCTEALKMWGNVDLFDADQVALALKDVDYAVTESGDSVNKTIVNWERFDEQLRAIGRNGYEIANIKSQLQTFGDFNFVDLSADAWSFAESLAGIGDGLTKLVDESTIEINLDNLSGLLQDIGATKEQVEGLVQTFQQTDDFNIVFTSDDQPIEDSKTALEEFAKQFPPAKEAADSAAGGIEGDMSKAAGAVDSATSSINNDLTTTAAHFDMLKQHVQQATNAITSMPNHKEVTITTNEVTTRTTQERAAGTKNALAGTSLVGERGEELVVSGNEAYLVGTHGPEIVDLKAGDEVFNALETKQIKRRGVINGVIPAFASGGTVGGTRGKYTSVISSDSSSASSTASAAEAVTSAAESISSAAEDITSSAEDIEEASTEIIDWIEVAIDRIERAIDKVAQIAESTYKKLSTRTNAIKDEIGLVTDEIDLQARAAKRYYQEAESVGLSEDLAQLVRDGTVDIREYDEETAELISDYKKWYEASLDCSKAVEELHETLASLYEDNFNNIKTAYENRLSLFEHLTKSYENGLDQLEAKGYFASTRYYEALSNVERKNISSLEEEFQRLSDAFDESMKSGEIEKWSESWYQSVTAINEVKEKIDEANLSLLEYAKTMRQMDWDFFDYTEGRISQITEESDFLINLLSHKNLYADSGQVNNEGMTTFGLRGLNYEVYMAQAQDYGDAILDINKQIAEDPYNKNIIARREELIKLQHESILAAEEEKDAIVDLVKGGIEIELRNLKNLIDEYENSLDAAKDLYDYNKNITEQTKNIANLKKTLSAYENDTSEETRARIQKLTVELQDAEDKLQETQYEQFVSDTKRLLDDMYNELEVIAC